MSESICVSELYDVLSSINKHVIIVPEMRKKYDEKVATIHEFHKVVTAFVKDFSYLIRLVAEICDDAVCEKGNKLLRIIKNYKYLEADCDRLFMAIAEFLKLLPNTENQIDLSKLGRLANRVKMGFFPTDLSHVLRIKEALSFPNRQINALDPCCGEGLALQTLCDNHDVISYGIELDRARADVAVENLDRVGYGSFYYSKIMNNAFHLIFLNPPYMSTNMFGVSVREEKTFLVTSMHRLMMGGIMIYIIPFYRMTEDICDYLTENLEDISVHKFRESEFKKFRQVVIIGKKKQRLPNREKSKQLQALSFSGESIPSIDLLENERYKIPDKEQSIKLFKGAEFNENELARQLEKSKSMNFIFDKSKIDNMQRNPALPLKVGQIGMIGGSGLMNGLIDCDTPHIIKGRVIKQKHVEESEDKKLGKREVKETFSNKMVFNIITADGFRSLT